MNPDDLITLIEQRAWIPIAALVVAFLTRLLKSDTKLPINVPARARIWIVFGLGILSGVLEHVVSGRTWTSALLGGLVTAAIAVVGHETLIASLRKGKEIPVPGLMIPGATPSPSAPVTVSVEPSPKNGEGHA